MEDGPYINIAEDFSETPGPGYKKDGDASGEEFYYKILKPKFELAIKTDTMLTVQLDGVWGYASSFLSTSFGGLSGQFGTKAIRKHLRLLSSCSMTVDLIKFEMGTLDRVEKSFRHACNDLRFAVRQLGKAVREAFLGTKN